MERYSGIQSVTFGQTTLPLPVSIRVSRQAEPKPAGRDSDAFTSSVELGRGALGIEVRIRDTSAAEGLWPGQTGALSFQLGPTRSGQSPRSISISSAVLVSIELEYEQTGPTGACLSFLAESEDGQTDPFSAQEPSQ